MNKRNRVLRGGAIAVTIGALASGLAFAQTPVPANDRTTGQDACVEIDLGFVATLPASASPVVVFPEIGDVIADATPVDEGFYVPAPCSVEDEPGAEESSTPERMSRSISAV